MTIEKTLERLEYIKQLCVEDNPDGDFDTEIEALEMVMYIIGKYEKMV